MIPPMESSIIPSNFSNLISHVCKVASKLQARIPPLKKKTKLRNQHARLSSTRGHDSDVGALFLLHREGVPKIFIKEEQSTF
jgi:hypothetical protein